MRISKGWWLSFVGIAGAGLTASSFGFPGSCGGLDSALIDYGEPDFESQEPQFPWGSRPLSPVDLDEYPTVANACEDILSYSCPRKNNDNGVQIAYGYDKHTCKDAAQWNTDVKAVGVAFPHVGVTAEVTLDVTTRFVQLGNVAYRGAKVVPILNDVVALLELSHDVLDEVATADGICTCSRWHHARRLVMSPIPDESCNEPSYCQFSDAEECEWFEYHATKDCKSTWVDFTNPNTNELSKIKDALEKTPLTIQKSLLSFGLIWKRCGGDVLGAPTARACCPSGSYAVKAGARDFDQIICVSERDGTNEQTLLKQACEQYCRVDVDGPKGRTCFDNNDSVCAELANNQAAAGPGSLVDTEAGDHVNCNSRIIADGREPPGSEEERMSGPAQFESIFDFGENCDPGLPIAATDQCSTRVRCSNRSSMSEQPISPVSAGAPFIADYGSLHGPLEQGGASNSDLIFAATGLPPGLSIDANTGAVSGTPDFESPGDFTRMHSVQIDVLSTRAEYPYQDSCRFTWNIEHAKKTACNNGLPANEGFCCNGLPGVQNGEVCCNLSCGTCGGTGCFERPGGRDNCCVANIQERGLLCSVSSAAPCIID